MLFKVAVLRSHGVLSAIPLTIKQQVHKIHFYKMIYNDSNLL